MKFKLKAKFEAAGDQPEAIAGLIEGVKHGDRFQTLLGVTGSGKTFTVANVIQTIQKPTLVIVHNKTLAAQLAQEYRDFFPDNAVHYFVSYYDFYQPEAYMPITDTYIEKEAQINEEIERLRHASTQALLTRNDVIIVATVSCIYGLGSPAEYEKVNLKITHGEKSARAELIRKLIAIHYERTNADLTPGTFRALGNAVEVMPANERSIVRIEFGAERIAALERYDGVSRASQGAVETLFLFPAKHFITDKEDVPRVLDSITRELRERLKELTVAGKLLEVERLKRRTNYDLALIREIGYCTGIENYSRHFSGKPPGEAPDTLLSYFPRSKDGSAEFLTIIDESHVTIPQIAGMHAGDASRKQSLIEHGFRLPSARDNRPLTFDEFEARIGQAVFTSATPGKFEYTESAHIVEQVIRPTGLVDPKVEVRPIIERGTYHGQVFDFISEALAEIKRGGRVMATTLTKKMAEDLAAYLAEKRMKTKYLHSDIETIERIQILTEFRKGGFDCLVGVNLLREGLDLPEVSFIGILDADKEGFLRSETSLIQTIGRAARNVEGRVILYADTMTGSMERALRETNRRRDLQIEYNRVHNITPKTIQKNIKDITEGLVVARRRTVEELAELDQRAHGGDIRATIYEKEGQLADAVKDLDFETAAILRDEIRTLAGDEYEISVRRGRRGRRTGRTRKAR